LANSPQSEALLEQILSPYQEKLDALVLGCTHYPFAKKTISKILGDQTKLFDGGAGTARQTMRCLENQGLIWDGSGSLQIENSKNDPQLIQLCMSLLKEDENG
jgi:glutamate racemase